MKLVFISILHFCSTMIYFRSVVQEESQRVSTEGQNFRMEMSDKFENAMKVNDTLHDSNLK